MKKFDYYECARLHLQYTVAKIKDNKVYFVYGDNLENEIFVKDAPEGEEFKKETMYDGVAYLAIEDDLYKLVWVHLYDSKLQFLIQEGNIVEDAGLTYD